jgi:hypothetical protein
MLRLLAFCVAVVFMFCQWGSIVKVSTKSLPLIIALICVFQADVCALATQTLSVHSESHAFFSQQDLRLGFLSEQQAGYSVKPLPSDSLKLKSPNLALTYAVIPGVIVHGAGHFYAGKKKTGAVLLVTGVAGAALATVSGFGQGLSHMDGGNSAPDFGYFLMAAGFGLFLGSWVYDMVGAPLAVQKYNKALLDKKAVGLKFRLQNEKPGVYFVWRF